MNWKKSATGKTVATVVRRYTIEPMRCYDKTPGAIRKSFIKYRLRVDGSAVGGATPVLFTSIGLAMRAAEEINAYGL